MHPDQIYTMTKLRAAEIQEQARHARMISGRKPEPLWQVLRARVRRNAGPVRIDRTPLARPDRHGIVADN
jgi:hypothetical protein